MRAVSAWRAEDLEQAIVGAAGCAARLRSRAQWCDHPQGQALAREPLIAWEEVGVVERRNDRTPDPLRPLAGMRVLDLTRVLAGPVATRFLAGYGADVLRIDAPDWNEPGVIPEVTLGKRCARLDLRTHDGRATFAALLADADVLVHGYRADALDRLGFGPEERASVQPKLIDVSLNAYGHSGPWRTRRGFDSLVQFSCGIAAEGMAWAGGEVPVPLPFQALDHATGYLMATAVVRAVTQRLVTGRVLRARTSLARTARLLMEQEPGAELAPFGPTGPADYAPELEPTSWGPAHRLVPPGRVGTTVMQWSSPAVELGSSPPAW
jgi:crotonobetainyl-CoA:carnitine CoA-transferase CaiB-like acyl-CoA transferase